MALFVCEGYTADSLHSAWEENGICWGGDLMSDVRRLM